MRGESILEPAGHEPGPRAVGCDARARGRGSSGTAGVLEQGRYPRQPLLGESLRLGEDEALDHVVQKERPIACERRGPGQAGRAPSRADEVLSPVDEVLQERQEQFASAGLELLVTQHLDQQRPEARAAAGLDARYSNSLTTARPTPAGTRSGLQQNSEPV